jgi:stage V sporulation protein B
MTTAPPLDPVTTGAAAAPPPPVDRAVEAGRGALFIAAGKVVFMLSGFVQRVLLARLGGADLGAFGAVNSAVSVVNNTVVQATIQSVSKLTAEDDSRAAAVRRAALSVQAVAGVIIGLGFFLMAPVIAAFEHRPDYTRYYRIAAAIPLLYAVYSVFIGSLNGQKKFRTQAGFDMTFSGLKTVLLVAGAAVAGVTGAFGGFAAAALLIVIIGTRVVGVPPAAEARGFPMKRLLVFMATVGSYNLLLNVELLYDQPLLHHFAGRIDPARAGVVAGHYEAMRTLAFLPYQALLVLVLAIFPLVSRATFAQDREATRAYVTQTLRYALILAAAMSLALGARPTTLIGILFKPEFLEAAPALPILVVGECCLAMLSVSCAILNASGRATAALVIMAATLGVGIGAAFVLVPPTEIGAPMMRAAALATSAGMVLGFVGSVIYLRLRLGGNPPLATVVRVAAAGAAALVASRFLPTGGKILGLITTVMGAIVYFAVLIVLREFGPSDRAKIRKILRRG